MTAIDGVQAHAGPLPWWMRLRRWVPSATSFPEATATFSRPVRRFVLVAALGTLPAAVAAAPDVPDQARYLATAWLTLLLTGPALALSAVAARRARAAGEAAFWRLWTVAVAALIANGFGLHIVAREDVLGLRALAPLAVAVSIGLFMVCNTTLMRRRSGGRSVALDAVETAIVTTVVIAAMVLLIGDRLLRSPVPWFTYPGAGALTGCIVGLVWVTVLFHRTPRHHRRLELIGIGLGAAAVVDASVQLAEGLSGFTLPAAPAFVVHQLTLTALLLVPLHASRVRVPGLERFAPQEQVRGSSIPTVLTILAIPVLGALALARRGQVPWAVDAFAFDAADLAVLVALRALLALNETKRLYRAVAVAAEERRRLLGALTRSLDGDRHRFAAQMHQQAIASYATFASYLNTASRVLPRGVPLPQTSEHVRAYLSRTAEQWRGFMLAVRPVDPVAPAPAASLRIAIVAHIVALTDDQQGPAVTVDVDGDLHLDWATEALVLRIVQEAVTYLDRVRLVGRLAVGVAAGAEGFELRLAAGGTPRAPAPDAAGGAGAPDTGAIESFVALGGGELVVNDGPDETVLVARLRRFGPAPGGTPDASPRLRIVPGAT
jgi:hypothetical protein